MNFGIIYVRITRYDVDAIQVHVIAKRETTTYLKQLSTTKSWYTCAYKNKSSSSAFDVDLSYLESRQGDELHRQA